MQFESLPFSIEYTILHVNKGLTYSRVLLKELDNLLRKFNFYAKSYKMIHEVEM